jgi:hypothetical protein
LLYRCSFVNKQNSTGRFFLFFCCVLGPTKGDEKRKSEWASVLITNPPLGCCIIKNCHLGLEAMEGKLEKRMSCGLGYKFYNLDELLEYALHEDNVNQS